MANEITLHGPDYIHLADRSFYNNNYFQHRETGEIIFEKCEEFEGTFAFWRWKPDNKIFLGRSENDLSEDTIVIRPDWI